MLGDDSDNDDDDSDNDDDNDDNDDDDTAMRMSTRGLLFVLCLLKSRHMLDALGSCVR